MTKHIVFVLCSVFCILTFTACDQLMQKFVNTPDLTASLPTTAEQTPTMEVISQTFSDDYKTLVVTTKMLNDVPAYRLEDSTKVRVDVSETINGMRHTRRSQPQLIHVRNVEREGVEQNDVRMLILVDKTMPQSELDKVRGYVAEIRTVFNNDKLFVAFMDGEFVTKSIPVTDYILSAYFTHSDNPNIYLYRSMQQKFEEMSQYKTPWKDAKRMVMMVFADDRVYDDHSDTPIDPDHYHYEEMLIRTATADSTFLAYFVNMDTERGANDEDDQNVPSIFCKNHGGAYIMDFKWATVKRKIYAAYRFEFPDIQLVFVNPDYKVYRGDNKILTLKFYDRKNNKLLTTCTITVTMGELYKPIIVRGHNIVFVLLQGFILTIIILLLVYLVLQFIVPGIQYAIFRKHFVLPYSGPNMSVNGKPVGQTCYYCKAPFYLEDKIVVKCEHTMHESCWEENEYHCTEYGDRCKDGHHYFNRHNLFDIRNASFYLKWVLAAIFAAALAWLTFTLFVHFNHHGSLLERFMRPPVSQIPFIGAIIGFFYTSVLSSMISRHKGWRGVLQVFVRTAIATSLCYASFLLVNAIILFFGVQHGIDIFNAVAWVAAGFIIALSATVGTRVEYSRKLLLLTLGLGVLTMVVWVLFYQVFELDYRVLLLLSFVIYGVGMAMSVAFVAPRSNRYFLKVEGAVKTMDVALYKWFRNNPNRVVTIGKSVDCSLQLSWDIQTPMAPIEAEIRQIYNIPYLIAREPGVFIKGKPVRIDRKIRLYHGKSFSIGQTTFTYIEKDR